MKLLIVTHKKDISCDRIIEEAEKKNIEVLKILYSNLDILENKRFDFCILRYPRGFEKDFQTYLKKILVVFKENQLLDYKTYKKYPYFEDKLFQHTLFEKTAIMPEFNHYKTISDVDIKSFSVVVKKRVSGRCKEIFLLNSEDEIKKFFSKRNIDEYLFEEYLDVRKDIRIIIANNKAIGATERRVYVKDREGYNGIGVKINKEYMPSEKIKEKAITISKMLGCDFCGVDFIIDKNENVRLIECNLTPEFKSSERILNVNIAKKLIEFVLDKSKGG